MAAISIARDHVPTVEHPRLDLVVGEHPVDRPVKGPEHELRSEAARAIANDVAARRRDDPGLPSPSFNTQRFQTGRVQPRRFVEHIGSADRGLASERDSSIVLSELLLEYWKEFTLDTGVVGEL